MSVLKIYTEWRLLGKWVWTLQGYENILPYADIFRVIITATISSMSLSYLTKKRTELGELKGSRFIKGIVCV